MKPYRAEVRWRDPFGAADWMTRKQARKLRPVDVTTHGWVIYEDKDVLVVAASRTSDKGWGDVTAIPGGCVVKVNALPQG